MERLIMLTPIPPAGTGNGLAMRAELFRGAASNDLEVEVVVVPVAGQLPEGAPRSGEAVVVRPDLQEARAGLRSLIADPLWRERLVRIGELPSLARSASPGLADAVVRALGARAAGGVHVMRSYLAPLGLAVAERTGARWITLDLDEDDAALAGALGEPEEGRAYDRLLAGLGSSFDGLAAASAVEAKAIGQRHGLEVEVVPNAVELPSDLPVRPALTSDISLLFVGNLTYLPNIEAAHELVQAILPALRRRLNGSVRLSLVGSHVPGLESLAGPEVEVRGFLADLRGAYASADVAIVPLRVGGGTRIKLLEAFAYGLPVVASAVAAEGLRVADGRHLLLAEDADGFTMAMERLLASPELVERLITEARRLVRDEYSSDAVMPTIGRFFRRADVRVSPGITSEIVQ
jgi:glycosyltransferase involved in cell wall biosynthesis